MVGLELPVLAMEHQYLITEDLPRARGRPQGAAARHRLRGRDLHAPGTRRHAARHLRARRRALVAEHDALGLRAELLPNDLERIAPSLEVGFEHFPALGEAGIRKVVNGPFTFAPDGNPLVGPIRGLQNFWVACGVMAGFSQGGGVGLALSHWMVDGDPGADVWAMDVARYGDWATLAYTNAKVRENYSRRFRIRFPNEELPAARPLRTTPVYERLQAPRTPCSATTAASSTRCGSRRSAKEASEDVTFRRSNAHEHVAAECRAVREGVGLLEISNYGKFEVTGPARRGMAGADHGQPRAGHGAHRAVADAQRARQADRRLHPVPRRRRPRVPHLHLRRRGLLPALVRAPPAAAGRHGAPLRDGVRRPVGRRPAARASCCRR